MWYSIENKFAEAFSVMSDVIVIGIAGGTGSGKSTITKKLIQRFGDDVSVIHHDNYYKAQDRKSVV